MSFIYMGVIISAASSTDAGAYIVEMAVFVTLQI